MQKTFRNHHDWNRALMRIGSLCLLAAGWLLMSLAPPIGTAQISDIPREAAWVTNGSVRAIAVADGVTYIGGNFSHVGLITGNGVPLDVGTGLAHAVFPMINGELRACVSDGAGGWYIGGSFTQVGGLERNRIAHILADGTVNPDWNPDANDTVRALAVFETTVYAGGIFTSIGGQTRNRIAALDATTGAATDWNPDAGDTVLALAVTGSTVYAGGGFTSIGGQTRNYIVALDTMIGAATDWNPNADGWIYALAVSGTTVYAGGIFTSIGGQTRSSIVALDSTTGNATGWNPNADLAVRSLAVTSSTVYAGGDFSSIGGQTRNCIAALDITTGNATSWNPNANNDVRSLAVTGSTVYVGGDFGIIGGQTRSRIAALDITTGAATDWNPNATNTVYALGISGTTVYAGGAFNTIGGQMRKNIAALDSSTGILTPWNPGSDNTVHALAVSPDGTTVYAGGAFSSIGGQTRPCIAALNNTNGNATAWNPWSNNTVYALAVTGSTVYAGGIFTSIGGQTRNRIAALDATTGAATDWNPDAGNTVRALAVTGSTVYAGGGFTSIGGQTRNYIAALDTTIGAATDWNPNANDYVLALAVSGSTIYAGGEFTSIGGQARNRIAALDATVNTNNATAWNPNAGGGIVLALSISSTTVYAGGLFTSIGGPTRNRIAALDATVNTFNATTWNPSAGGAVYAIAVSGSTVYAGGQFASIGGQPRHGFAQFDSPPVPASPTLGSAKNIGTDTITWTWQDNATDETGFKLYADPGIWAPITLRTTTAANVQEWQYGSLSTNAAYTFTVVALNANGASNDVTEYITWTLAATPVAPEVNNPTLSTLDVTLGGGDGNPAHTEYAIYCSTTSQWIQSDGSLGAAPAWQTATTWGVKTVTGLAGATQYIFTARARNGADIETADGPAGSGYTMVTLTYTAGANGSITGTSPQVILYGSNGSQVEAVANSGYTFINWSDTSMQNPRQDTNVTEDISVTANFAANTYTVTFNANGGSTPDPASNPVTFDAAYGALATTSRTGYTFAGWFTAPTGGTEVTAATVVATADDHTLYAQWVDDIPPVSLLDPRAKLTFVGTLIHLPFTTSDAGSGVDLTELWVKTPGSGAFSFSGMIMPGPSGLLHYTFPAGNGLYEFATKATDIAMNAEPDPVAAEVTVLVNTVENGAFTWTLAAADAVTTFPMTNEIDVVIAITGATPGGTITVSRTTPFGIPPGGLSPDQLINENLTIVGAGLGTGWTATITWPFNPDSALGMLPGYQVDSVFQFDGPALTQTYPVTPEGSKLIIPGVMSFSDWYAGTLATSHVVDWILVK